MLVSTDIVWLKIREKRKRTMSIIAYNHKDTLICERIIMH